MKRSRYSGYLQVSNQPGILNLTVKTIVKTKKKQLRELRTKRMTPNKREYKLQNRFLFISHLKQGVSSLIGAYRLCRVGCREITG